MISESASILLDMLQEYDGPSRQAATVSGCSGPACLAQLNTCSISAMLASPILEFPGSL